jgi:hypothetical protein
VQGFAYDAANVVFAQRGGVKTVHKCGHLGVSWKKGRMLFFEKKNQKTFATLGWSQTQPPGQDSATAGEKFFWFFFFKKRTTFFINSIQVLYSPG